MRKGILLSILIAAGAAGLYSAESGLGLVTSAGQFLLNDARVSGNATITDGARIQTVAIPSMLRLNSGARVELGSDSKARVYRDRIVLESGTSDLLAPVKAGPAKYEIEAASLRLSPAGPGTMARVVRSGERAVQVGVTKGTMRVFNAKGMLLANVVPGAALQLEPQAPGAAAPSSFAGCLLKKDGKWVLYDQTTRIVAELRGSIFDKEWGNRVQIVGTTDPNAQSDVGAQVVDVTTVTRFAEGGCQPVASSINADLPPGTPATSVGRTTSSPGKGMSAGAKFAIIGGVAAGAGIGIAVAAGGGNDRSN